MELNQVEIPTQMSLCHACGIRPVHTTPNKELPSKKWVTHERNTPDMPLHHHQGITRMRHELPDGKTPYRVYYAYPSEPHPSGLCRQCLRLQEIATLREAETARMEARTNKQPQKI